MEMPIIGILGIIDNEIVTRLQSTYAKAIEFSGGSPLLLPYVEKDESIEAFVRLCDGFLFTGGVDVDPMRYGEKIKATCGEIQTYRDELEFKVFEKAYKSEKPIMAICRGAQLVNVTLGGTLYQDIPSEIKTTILHTQKEPKNAHSHAVRIIHGTPLSQLIKAEHIPTNSFHHQAVKTLGKNLAAMATADDGIIEALYSLENRYLRAYQWHPERLFEADKNQLAVFEDFISACRLNK